MSDIVFFQVFNTACILKETLFNYLVGTGLLRRA
jgi:hypothetical protein